MNIVVAIDSFKGSLTSLQAGNAVKDAIMRMDDTANVSVRPLADGGEGTVDALSVLPNAEIVEITVCGPLMNSVKAKYGILRDKNLAVIEMAEASGINLINPEQLNPMKTTTFGVGEMINDAIKKGCRNFLIGIGGSSTNDGGVGMLQALGFAFLDKDGNAIQKGAQGLKDLHSISAYEVSSQLKDCTFRIACDVKNPLCGENGCSKIFAPQKGATADMITHMDIWLENYANIATQYNPKANPNLEGAGAAGGLGFAFSAFLNATLEPGIDIVLQETDLETYIKDADVVVTGEGRLDAQTVMGKAPIGVAKLAKKYKKPVVAFSGCVTEQAEVCNKYGIDAFFPILRQVTTLEDALDTQKAYRNLEGTAYQVFRLFYISR